VVDGPIGLLGRLAGHGDDLDDRLGTERGRLTGPGGVVKEGLQEPRQRMRPGLGFNSLEVGRRREPAIPPEPDRDASQAELTGHRIDARVVRQGQDDGGAADPTLVGRLLPLETPQHVELRR
jgi:hypothetical protein